MLYRVRTRKSAWVPIFADNYMHINCLWVSGALKGNGYSPDLLNQCIENSTIEEVSVGGESGTDARLIKDGKEYRILRRYQHSQAKKANINFRIGKYLIPETIDYKISKE